MLPADVDPAMFVPFAEPMPELPGTLLGLL